MLKNGLFVRRPISNLILRCSNYFHKKSPPTPIPKSFDKILLSNIANLGDVVISTTVLPVIKKYYPKTQIDFLTSSAGSIVLKNHPLVSEVLTFDHWYIHKKRFGNKRKLTRKLSEYPIAIDLYTYFPNSIPTLAKAKIPVRIGYPTGGFSRLLTHEAVWDFQNCYMGFSHLHLLRFLGIDVSHESPLPSYNFKNVTGDYIVVHMGTSNPLKEWDVDNWIDLIQKLQKQGFQVVLTGNGGNEGNKCQYVYKATAAKNLCNQLNWHEFVLTIQQARLVVTVDSVSAHIAAGSRTPAIVLFSGMNSLPMWLPPNPECKGLTNQVPCAPCFLKKGCSSMRCIRNISVVDVYRAVMANLP